MKILITGLIILTSSACLAKNVKSPFIENVTVSVQASGDLAGLYEFSGQLGSELKATAEGSPCEISGLFRKVLFQKKYAVEGWMTLECTLEGQKNTYKLAKVELELPGKDLPSPLPEIQIAGLSKNLKNFRLKFQELSLKKGK